MNLQNNYKAIIGKLSYNFIQTIRSSKDLKIYLKSLIRLNSYHNKHKGERCFIIGNGPSLKYTDLSLLRNEFTFGLNRIYLLFPKLGFSTTYLVSVNQYVIEQFASEIVRAPCPKFINWYYRKYVHFQDDVIFFRPVQKIRFSNNPVYKSIWNDGTVTYVAMQLAFFMGFKKVILIGVDHSFTTEGSAHQLVVSDGEDPNHFDKNYFGKGVRWQLPDLKTSEIAYQLAEDYYKANDREIVDATINGQLKIFKKVEYSSLF